MTTTTTQVCRSCQGTLDPFLDLGSLQLSGYLTEEQDARPSMPLVLTACSDCHLVQLQHTTPRDQLFTQYWYRSGVNEVMRAELAHIVEDVCKRVDLEPGDIVVDTGANDGTLLSYYPSHQAHLVRVAYEPALNLQLSLAPHADMAFCSYFPEHFRALQRLERKVKVITSIAMFYAVEQVHPFLAAVKTLLHEDGAWMVQFQDLAAMVAAAAFDNVCHEHLMYYSLASFEQLIAQHGLVVTRVESRPINGGSMRLTVRHEGWVPHRGVAEVRAWERRYTNWGALETFAWRVGDVKRQIVAAVEEARARGKVIDLYGASTKANTLLQVCGLTGKMIRQAWERSPEKWGRRTAGTDIPIVSEEQGRHDPPDALLVGIWQFREAVLQREARFLDHGGAVFFPLPGVDIVTSPQEVRRGA